MPPLQARGREETDQEDKEVPYCLTRLPKCGRCGNCDDYRECQDVRYKRVLIKKEITCGETCVTKCVPEEFVERKLVKVCRPMKPEISVVSTVRLYFESPAAARRVKNVERQ